MNISSKNNEYNKNTSFYGLNKVIQKRIYNNPEFLKTVPDIYKREKGSVGNLPKDLFNLFKTNSKQENAKKIADVKEALNVLSDILLEIEDEKIKNGKNLNKSNLFNPFLPLIAKVHIQPERIPRIISDIRRKFTPSKDVISGIAEKGEKYLEEKFKEIGVIAEKDKLSLKYLDQGKFKNTFKLRLLNEKGEDIIHPKVILSFKPQNKLLEQINLVVSMMSEYFQSYTPKKFMTIVDNILSHASVKVVPPAERDKYRSSLLNIYSKMKTIGEVPELNSLLTTKAKDEIKYNGIGAEANITQFVKKAAGHPLDKSDYIDVYYLNLNNNIGISEFSDENLPEITQNINLHKYGLFHDDLMMNRNNLIAGRVIDYGGIKPLYGFRTLTINKTARRYYHKLSQIKYKDDKKTQLERVKYWNKLYKLASEHKVSNHGDILVSLEKSKRLINPEYWFMLADVRKYL